MSETIEQIIAKSPSLEELRESQSKIKSRKLSKTEFSEAKIQKWQKPSEDVFKLLFWKEWKKTIGADLEVHSKNIPTLSNLFGYFYGSETNLDRSRGIYLFTTLAGEFSVLSFFSCFSLF